MRKFYKILLFQTLAISAWSQGSVGINTGTNGPHESAILDLNSSTKGFKLPLADPAVILNPTLGLITHHNGITYQYTALGWQPLLTNEDNLWETFSNYTVTKNGTAVNVGSYLPPYRNKLTVGNIGAGAEVNAIFSLTSRGNALLGSSSDDYALASIYGEHTSSTGLHYGGMFRSDSNLGVGVFGVADSIGILGQAQRFGLVGSAEYIGVHGEVSNSEDNENAKAGSFINDGNWGNGIYAEGGLIAGQFNNDKRGISVTSINSQSGYFSGKRGLVSEAWASDGIGVSGQATNESDSSTGVGGYFKSNGGWGIGVVGVSITESSSPLFSNVGGCFRAEGPNGIGVTGVSTNGTYGGSFSATSGIGVTSRGGILGGSFNCEGSDCIGVKASGSLKGGEFLSSGTGLSASGGPIGGVFESTGVVDDTYGGRFTTISPDGTGIYARGKKAGAVLDGDLVVNSYDNTTARISLYEADDYGFQLEYDGANDKLSLWSRKFSGNEAKRMTWQKNGNVGIGTDSPEHVLDIEKNANQELRMKSTAGSSDILLDGTTGSNAIEFLENGTFKSSLGWSVTNDRFFIYQQGNALTVKNGNVGIKDTDPTYSLELPNNATTGEARAYAWTTYSDKRIKLNIKDLDYGLNTICSLQPKSYEQHSANFEGGTLNLTSESKQTIGLLAQDVYQIIPEAVQKPEDELTDLWSMDYEKIIPVLIQAIKEQNDIINTQMTQLELYKEKSKDQEHRLESLEILVKSDIK